MAEVPAWALGRRRPGWQQGLVLVGAVGLTLAVGALGALATAPAIEGWYAGIETPALTPPDTVFGPVWTALYVLIAGAAWQVWRVGEPGEAGPALSLWGAQLALNAAWSPAFFGLRSPALGLAVIVPLLALVGWTVDAVAEVDRRAAWAMAPYLAWVAFATVLNAAIWWLNRGG
jgi:tryptophan-rich sensory protein